MSARKLFENDEAISSVTVDMPVSREPIAPYIKRISQALRSEQEAIREYQMILDLPSLPQNIKNAITEIMNDETDHMVSLSAIIGLEIGKAFPNYGDIDPETGLEIDIDTEAEDEEKETKTEASKLKRKKIHKADELKESIESTQISTDGINNTITYKVVADVQYDEDNILKASSAISDSIDRWNKANEDEEVQLTLVSFGAGQLTYKVKISNDIDFDKEKVTQNIVNHSNDLVWL